MRAHRASFFTLLAAPAPAPTLVLGRELTTQGTVVTATVGIPQAAGLHAVQTHATTPDGKPADWLRQIVIVGDKTASVDLRNREESTTYPKTCLSSSTVHPRCRKP